MNKLVPFLFLFVLFLFPSFFVLGALLCCVFLFIQLRSGFNSDIYTELPFLFSIILGGILITSNSYFFPNTDILNNADHTVLQHDGWAFRENIQLSTAVENSKVDALFSEYDGHLSLQCDRNDSLINLEIQFQNDFFEPFYFETFQEETKAYTLANLGEQKSIQFPFTLDINTIRLTFLRSTINDQYFALKDESGKIYETNIPIDLRYGISLNSIISSANYPLSQEYLNILQGSYFLRTVVYKDTEYLDDVDTRPTLVLFPSRDLYSNRTNVTAIYEDGEVTIGDNLFNPLASVTSSYADNSRIPTFFIGLKSMGGNRGHLWRVMKGKNNFFNLINIFPERYKLNREANSNTTFFINTDEEDIVTKDYTGGYTYFYNTSAEFRNHVKANFRYSPGHVKNQLVFGVVDNYEIGSSSPIQLIPQDSLFHLKSANEDMAWVFQFHNFRASHNLQPYTIYIALICLGILSIFILTLIPAVKQNQRFVLFLVLGFGLFMLAIRFFLIWRIAVLPPIEDIKLNEYNSLRSTAPFMLSFTFWMAILSSIGLFIHSKNNENRYESFFNMPLLFSLAGCIMLTVGMRMLLGFSGLSLFNLMDIIAIVLIPLSMAFIVNDITPNYWRNLVFRWNWIDKLDTWKDKQVSRWDWLDRTLGKSGMIHFSIRNLEIEFFIFPILVALLLLIFSFTPWKYAYNTEFILAGVFLVIYSFYCERERDDYESSKVAFPYTFSIVYILLSFSFMLVDFGYLPAFGLTGLVLLMIYLYRKKKSKSWLIAPLLLFIIVIPSSSLVTEYVVDKCLGGYLKESKTNVYFRQKMMFDDINEVAAKTDFSSSDKKYFLWAAQNKWFITNYMLPFEEASPLGFIFNDRKHKAKYQNHSNKGVNFLTQTNDMTVLRYLISEHDELTIICVLLLQLLVLFLLTLRSRSSSIHHFMALAAFLFLVIMSIIVWMTITNRFVFFGQDFPIFSINATITHIGNLLLLGLVFLTFNQEVLHGHTQVKQYKYIPIFLTVMILFSYGLDQWKGVYNNKAQAQENFSLNEALAPAREYVKEINKEYKRWQRGRWGNTNGFSDEQLEQKSLELWNDYQKSDPIEIQRLVNSTSEKDAFAQSVFEQFIGSEEKHDPLGLIYLQRKETTNNGNTSRLRLRSNYFDIPSINYDQKNWSGSIYSAFVKEGYLMTNQGVPIPIDWNEEQTTALNDRYNNIDIHIIPAEYRTVNVPLVLINATQRSDASQQTTFTISDDISAFTPKELEVQGDLTQSHIPVKLKASDYITYKNYDETIDQYLIRLPNSKFLSKNIWLNGKSNRKVFPFSGEYLWPYYLSSTLTSYHNGIAKDSSEATLGKDYYSTIDYSLTKDILEELSSNNKQNARYGKMSLVIMDGSGSIRVMVDRDKESSDPQLNPNDSKNFFKELIQFDLVSNSEIERRIFGLSPLLGMKFGPGSTVKPIIFSTLISGYNFNWDNFSVSLNPQTKMVQNEDSPPVFGYDRYAGKGASFFEGNDLNPGDFTSRNFLSESNNYFHSTLIFAGSFNREDFENTNKFLSDERFAKSSFLVYGNNLSKEDKFPEIHIGEKTLYFNPDNWPIVDKKLFNKEGSIMHQGLETNFALADALTDFTGERYRLERQLLKTNGLDLSSSASSIWSMPEKDISHLLLIDRDPILLNRSDNMQSFNTNDGLNQITKGGHPLSVTPLKMTEMTMRLFTQNRRFSYTVEQDFEQSYSFFDFDKDTYGNQNKYLQRIRDLIFNAIYIKNNKTAPSVQIPDGEEYHIYLKTGTTGDAESDEKQKTLVVMLSRDDLHKGSLTPERLLNNKLVCLYFVYNNTNSGWETIIDNRSNDNSITDEINKIIEMTMNSQTIQKYWDE
ncbi:MAG: hypothetical protein P1U56_18500 [Saprospiraceae bacterium]|nr:hypothetical protein [Saprospiraceae bacterium]